MNYNESLASVTTDPKEAIKIIADKMLTLRPRTQVTYHPYRKTDVYYDKHLDLRIIDLKKLYPQARPGNVVYIGTVLEACCETDAKINFIGNAKVIFEGKTIFDSKNSTDTDGKCRCALHLKQGDNPVTFMVRCDSADSFEFRFMPSVRWYWIWAKCYLLSARATSPIEQYKHEDGVGISRLYENEQDFDGEFIYPIPKSFDNTLDLSKIFPEESGSFAYALTYALKDTVLDIKCESEHKIYVNGIEKTSPLTLKSNDCILIKVKKDNIWLINYIGDDIGIPFLSSNRGCGDKCSRSVRLMRVTTRSLLKTKYSLNDRISGQTAKRFSGSLRTRTIICAHIFPADFLDSGITRLWWAVTVCSMHRKPLTVTSTGNTLPSI